MPASCSLSRRPSRAALSMVSSRRRIASASTERNRTARVGKLQKTCSSAAALQVRLARLFPSSIRQWPIRDSDMRDEFASVRNEPDILHRLPAARSVRAELGRYLRRTDVLRRLLRLAEYADKMRDIERPQQGLGGDR